MNANPFTKLSILSTVCAVAFVCYPSVRPHHPESHKPNVQPIARFAHPEIAPEKPIAHYPENVPPQSAPAEQQQVAAPVHPVPAHPDAAVPNFPNNHPHIHPNA